MNRKDLYEITKLLYLLVQHIIERHSKEQVGDLPPWQAMRKKVEECVAGLGMKPA